MSDDYALRPEELRSKHLPEYLAQRIAIFARKNFGVDEHSLVQLAREFTIERYGENHVGDKVYISRVSGASKYIPRMSEWAIEFGEAISKATPENKYYRRWLIPSYKADWGAQASLDGLAIVLHGKAPESVLARNQQYGCCRKAYKKVRNYVAGALLVQNDQFEAELMYSWRVHQYER